MVRIEKSEEQPSQPSQPPADKGLFGDDAKALGDGIASLEGLNRHLESVSRGGEGDDAYGLTLAFAPHSSPAKAENSAKPASAASAASAVSATQENKAFFADDADAAADDADAKASLERPERQQENASKISHADDADDADDADATFPAFTAFPSPAHDEVQEALAQVRKLRETLREAVRELAEAADWPALQLEEWRKVPGGRDAWNTFLSRANIPTLYLALQRLREYLSTFEAPKKRAFKQVPETSKQPRVVPLTEFGHINEIPKMEKRRRCVPVTAFLLIDQFLATEKRRRFA